MPICWRLSWRLTGSSLRGAPSLTITLLGWEVEFQRTMRTLAGLFQLVDSYPRLLNVFTRVGFHFFSHKLGRLPLPWADAASGGQALLYGLALAAVNYWVPAGFALKRLSAVCRTFVVLMLIPARPVVEADSRESGGQKRPCA